MKNLILIFMFSSLFADTVVIMVKYDEKFEVSGEYLGVLDSKIYLRTPNEKLKDFDCVDVVVVYTDDRVPIPFDCSENTYTPQPLTELDFKNMNKGVLSGIFIAIGSGILYGTVDMECNDIENYDNCLEMIQNNQKVGYIFLFLGGVLIALGI